MDQARASALAREGFELWQAGELEGAVPKYVEALRLADPSHYGFPEYLGEFAAILAALGRDTEALQQYELALASALRQNLEGTDAGVSVATYFLAEHLLKMQCASHALSIVQGSSSLSGKNEWLLRVVEARALWDLGRRGDAKTSAERAVASAPSEEKAAELRAHVAEIINSTAAG